MLFNVAFGLRQVFIFAFTCHQNIFTIANELSAKGAVSGQKLGKLQPFIAAAIIIPTGVHGRACIFQGQHKTLFLAPAEFSLPRVDRVIGAAIGAATAVYALIACCGYATYGGEVGPSHAR